MKITLKLAVLIVIQCFAQTHSVSLHENGYHSPFSKIETGKAPGMQAKLLSDNKGVKTYVIIFAKGDEVLSGLTDFAIKNKVSCAHFSAIGALKEATISWFDLYKKEYKLIPVKEQVELVSLIGDIGLSEGKPSIHAHMSVGLSDGQVKGGHLVDAYVFPTVEVFLTVLPQTISKKLDTTNDVFIFDVKN